MLAVLAAVTAAASKPHIMMIIADDFGKVERSINQIAHNHLVYKTAVTGVYYATSGWANASQATAIQLIRPCSLESKIGPSMLSIKPKAGSMLLFPSYILHAADIHLGDQKRVSFAFNAAA
eukprot:gene10296-10741_t